MTHIEYYQCENCGTEHISAIGLYRIVTPGKRKEMHYCDALCLREWVMRELRTDG